MSQAMNQAYRIAYTKHAYSSPYTHHWTSWHETIEETAITAQDYCVEQWPKPPAGRKEIVYYSDHHESEGGSCPDPYQVAAIVLQHRAIIDAGYKLTVNIELEAPTEHGLIPIHSLEICKPSAVRAKEEAERARRRAIGRVHYCGDEFCDGDCDTLPCGCFRECWCGSSKPRRYDPYDGDW